MSQDITRQSQRIRDPSYRRRTTWRLPEIVTVHICIMQFHVPVELIFSSFLRLSLLHPSFGTVMRIIKVLCRFLENVMILPMECMIYVSFVTDG